MVLSGLQIEQENTLVKATFEIEEVTVAVMQELIVELTERMRYSNAQHFIFDLTSVRFLNSACIGTLVQFLDDLAISRGRIVLAGCQENVEFVFRITRLDVVFPLVESIQEAREELGYAA